MTMPGSLIIILSLFVGYIFVYMLNMPKLNELRLLFFKVMAGVSVCENVDCVLWFPWSIDKHTIPWNQTPSSLSTSKATQ